MSANWEQERAAIDHGLRGDKIPFADPAAAPLGADEQAADARTPPEHIAQPRPIADGWHGTQSGGDLVPLAAIGAVAAITAAALVAPLF
jgi:hypothetical protein